MRNRHKTASTDKLNPNPVDPPAGPSAVSSKLVSADLHDDDDLDLDITSYLSSSFNTLSTEEGEELKTPQAVASESSSSLQGSISNF